MAKVEALAKRAERLAGELKKSHEAQVGKEVRDPQVVEAQAAMVSELFEVTAAVSADQRIAAIDAEIEALQLERAAHVETVARVLPSPSRGRGRS